MRAGVVFLLLLLPGCASFSGGPRVAGRWSGTSSPPATEPSAAQQGLINAIAQLRTEIKLLAKVQANVAAQIGVNNTSNQVGGDQILDSKVALLSVAGLVVLSLGLAYLYRGKAINAEGAGKLMVRAIEAHRDNGAKSVIDSLQRTCAKSHKYARALHKIVKAETE